MARYDGPHGPADGYSPPPWRPGSGPENGAAGPPSPLAASAPAGPWSTPPRAAPEPAGPRSGPEAAAPEDAARQHAAPDRPAPPVRGRIYYAASRPAVPAPPSPAPPAAGQAPLAAPARPAEQGLEVSRERPLARLHPGLVVALVCLLALGLAATGVAVVQPGPVRGWFDRTSATPAASEPADVVPSPVLAAAATDAPAPTAAGLAAALDPLLRDPRLGAPVTASVIDVVTGESLYARGPDTPTTPASTTKLITAITVLAARGPAYRIPTVAVAGAGPGEVVLVGGGDPTLAAGAVGSYPGAGRLDDLARQVTQALGGVAPTRVVFDTSRFTGPAYGPGWDADITTGGHAAPITALMTDAGRVDPKDLKGPALRHAAPDLAAAQAFAKALGLPTTAVTRGRAPGPPPPAPGSTTPGATGPGAATPGGTGPALGGGASPAAGTLLGTVYSPPLVRLVEIMLAESDNVIAEALARQVATAKGEPASYAGAAAATVAVLGELGLPVGKGALVDGSGLSRLNRLTPSLLTGVVVLAARADRPELHGIFSGLPVAGYSGTLRDRYRTAAPVRPGTGTVRAKTGTLSGISAISGIVVTRDGRLLAFAVLADKVPVGQFPAQDAIDRVAAALAGCGCRA